MDRVLFPFVVETIANFANRIQGVLCNLERFHFQLNLYPENGLMSNLSVYDLALPTFSDQQTN
jgi:hypothetical protein